MKDEKYFRTSSFYPAVFLFAKGMELANVDKTANPKRATFVFVDTPERESYLQSFNSGAPNQAEAQVDARKFVVAIRTLKEKIYDQNF